MACVSRRLGAAMVMASALALVAGCTSPSQTTTNAAMVNPGADRSATYPDITARVQAATAQMSNEEAAKISARVSATGSSAAVSIGALSRRAGVACRLSSAAAR